MKKDLLFVFIQFVLFAVYFMDWPLVDFSLPDWATYVAYAGVGLGLLVVFFGIINLNENLTPFPSPKRRSSLISTGIYQYVRHPIYLGILLAMFSFALASVSVFRLLITLVMVVVFYFKTNLEERLLQQRFAEYRDYMRQTGRFFHENGITIPNNFIPFLDNF